MISTLLSIAFATFLGLSKNVILAHAVSSDVYGSYVTFFSLSTFLGLFLGFGLSEDTIKKYPQWISQGAISNVTSDIVIKTKKVAIRHLVITFVAYFLYIFFQFDLILTICVIVLSFLSFETSLMSSLMRSMNKQLFIRAFFLIKSISALVFVCIFYKLGKVNLLLLGEMSSLVFVIILCLYFIRIYSKTNFVAIKPNYDFQGKKNINLYFVFLIGTFISNTDKLFVSLATSASAVGLYSIVCLIPQIFQNIANVCAQYFGPKIIVMLQDPINKKIALRYYKLIIQGFLLIACLVFIFLWVVKFFSFGTPVLQKYNVENIQIFLACALGFSQVTYILEFYLIGFNFEKKILNGYLIAMFVFLILFGSGIYLKPSISYFLASMLICRFLNLLYNQTVIKNGF